MWLYVAEGAMRAGSDHGISATLAVIEVVISLVLFTACCIHIGRASRRRRLAVAARALP